MTNSLSSSIAAGSYDDFSVRLDTASTGTKAGQISFTTNDGNENPFNFSITGTVHGTASGPIAISLDSVIQTNGPARGIGLSPDDSRLYVAFWEDNPTSRVQQYSLPNAQLLQTIEYGYQHTHGDVVVSSDGNRIFTTNYYPDDVSQVDLANSNQRTDLSTGNDTWPANIDVTPDRSKVLAAVGMDGRGDDMNNDRIAIYDIANGAFSSLASVDLNDEPQGVKIGFSADSKFAYVVTRQRKSSSARLYEISLDGTYAVTRSKDFPGVSLLQGVTVAGNQVYVSSPDHSKIWVVDRSSWGTPSEINLPDSPNTLAMRPGNRYLLALLPKAQAVIAIDTQSGNIVDRYNGLATSPSDVEFNSDGSKMYISHTAGDGDVWVFDIGSVAPASIVGRIDSGWWYVQKSNGTGFVNERWGKWGSAYTWNDVVVGDFNGDGYDDIAGRLDNGWWFVQKSNGTGFVNERWGKWGSAYTWNDVVVGDFNGDGSDDIAGRIDSGWWYVQKSNGTNRFTNEQWGKWGTAYTWSNVVVGDFNGDGSDDIAGRIDNGRWYVQKSNGTNGFTNEYWGKWGSAYTWSDVTVGDFNGDGSDDIAGCIDSGWWYVNKSTGTGFLNEQWGKWGTAYNWNDVMGGCFDG